MFSQRQQIRQQVRSRRRRTRHTTASNIPSTTGNKFECAVTRTEGTLDKAGMELVDVVAVPGDGGKDCGDSDATDPVPPSLPSPNSGGQLGRGKGGTRTTCPPTKWSELLKPEVRESDTLHTEEQQHTDNEQHVDEKQHTEEWKLGRRKVMDQRKGKSHCGQSCRTAPGMLEKLCGMCFHRYSNLRHHLRITHYVPNKEELALLIKWGNARTTSKLQCPICKKGNMCRLDKHLEAFHHIPLADKRARFVVRAYGWRLSP
ncbi:uncharacterized protein LOC121645026 [Melanotaenia boesemani]|uniref:uncharacterized protein LOC121645026 n=1 Tax=Melanotaenia boesemani TaxID=1250792 RepID=UPI001C042FFD|nr:uncharacterized protein LOC121645026 [Melanotaenia boesemani]